MGLLKRIMDHAQRDPTAVCFHYVSRGRTSKTSSYGDTVTGAARAASGLAAAGVRPGDIVVLIGTHHPDLYATWLGAVWLGAVPSLIAEPSVRMARDIYWTRLQALLEHMSPRVIACDPRFSPDVPLVGVASTTYPNLAQADAPTPERYEARDDDLALLQHSSGTTGLQKGVMLTHGAVLRHADAYGRATHFGAEDVIASWLPLYHDMGFIACFVTPMLTGASVAWLSPFEWVAQPGTLISVVHEHRATRMWLPNFAFAFLATRAPDPKPGTDLSCLRSVVNCSEPVTTAAMDAFAERYSEWGFDRTKIHACYAMAENVFAVTTSSDESPGRRIRISRSIWLNEHRAVASSDADAIEFESNGVAVSGCEVRILDDHSHEVESGQVGRILVRSPFLFGGYYRREDLNRDIFDAEGWFDTGDLGFLDEDNHLYVTGRRKDLIIIGGRNIYPQDVEAVANGVAGVHPGRVVCFGVRMKTLETEGLVVLVESDQPEAEWEQIAATLRREVPAVLDLDLADARVVGRGTLRKSSSGKLARAGNCEWYLSEKFGPLPPAISGEPS